MAISWKKALVRAFISAFIAMFSLWHFILKYPFYDSLIISFVLSALFVPSAVIYLTKVAYVRKEDAPKVAALVIGVIGAIVALQAAWPIVMPRISIDDANPESGVFFGDKMGTDQYQIVRETIVKVKPPLFPLFDSTYPIANNLRLLGTTRSLNLQIENVDNGQSIKVKLGPVTGWSFDEVTGKIKYQADGGFNFVVSGTNVSDLGKYYRNYAILDNRENDLPVHVVNLTYLVERDTSAWRDIKKWVDNGSCVLAYYSDQWDLRNSTTTYQMSANDKSSQISKDTMNSPITLKMFYIRVEPRQIKEAYVVFMKTDCIYY